MNSHVSNIAQTCYFEQRRLASIRIFLTSTVTATLVSGFVLSRIDYCNSLLFGTTDDVTSHLHRIHNNAARVPLRLAMSPNMTTHLNHIVEKKKRHKLMVSLLYYTMESTRNSYEQRNTINNTYIYVYI